MSLGAFASPVRRAIVLSSLAIAAASLFLPTVAAAEPGTPSLQDLEARVAAQPQDAEALAQYGLALVRAERQEDGLAALARAGTMAPDEPRVQLLRAQGFAAAGNSTLSSEIALKVASSPLASSKLRSEAHFTAAVAFVKAGLLKDAEKHFTEATTLDPSNAAAFLNLGVLYTSSDRQSSGVSALLTAAERAPDDWQIQRRVADLLDVVGETDATLPMRERAVALRPDDLNSRYQLAKALMSLRQPERAIEHMRKAVEIAPESGYARLSLAQLLVMREQVEEALVHARKAQELGMKEAAGVIEYAESLSRGIETK